MDKLAKPRRNLRAEMARRGYARADVAKACGVSVDTVGAWLMGRRSPSVSQAVAASRGLFDGLAVEYLFIDE